MIAPLIVPFPIDEISSEPRNEDGSIQLPSPDKRYDCCPAVGFDTNPIQTQLIPTSAFQDMTGSTRVIFYLFTGSSVYDTIEVKPDTSTGLISVTYSTIDGNYIFNIYGIGK